MCELCAAAGASLADSLILQASNSIDVISAIAENERVVLSSWVPEPGDLGEGVPSSKPAAGFVRTQEAFRANMHGHLDDLMAGRITGSEALKRMTGNLQKAHLDAYRSGKSNVLGKSASIVADDMAYLARANAYELGFLRGFVDDVITGAGTMGYHARMDLYAGSLRGFYNNAMVEYADDVLEVSWELGIAEHCEGCIALEGMNPWTKASLPTVPGAGDTPCHSKCKCHLEWKRPASKRARADVRKAVQGANRPSSLANLFSLPPAPGNLTAASVAERTAVESIRQEMNYWRRAMAEAHEVGDTGAFKHAARMRRRANADLIDYTESNKIWSPPSLSVDEVLSGQVLDNRLVDEVFAVGMDGYSTQVLTSSQYDSVTREILKSANRTKAAIAKAKAKNK